MSVKGYSYTIVALFYILIMQSLKIFEWTVTKQDNEFSRLNRATDKL
jgi:hypothetical protein